VTFQVTADRTVWAEIDVDALQHNVRVLKAHAPGTELIAVVKANAYGHGAIGVARWAVEGGADRLAVTSADEGEQLRRSGIAAPILVLAHSTPVQADRLARWRLTATVNDLEMGRALSDAALRHKTEAQVHVKVDTGMNRYGSDPDELIALATALRELPGIHVEGLYTHFANADMASPDFDFTHRQIESFCAVADRLPWIPYRHASNSGAYLQAPEYSFDGVRVGLSLYGYYPGEHIERTLDLRPVMTLKTRVSRVHELEAGETVSYGRTWTAPERRTVALVMAGYGDGLRRCLSNRGTVLIRGQRVPIIGSVCMDMCLADVTDLPGAATDDEVVVLGRQGDATISAEEIADLYDTITWEVLTGIQARAQRVYVREGQILGVHSLLESPVYSNGAH
jgi:alanine racemase